jgi:hypothetical protein
MISPTSPLPADCGMTSSTPTNNGAPWQQLDDEILEILEILSEMLQFSKKSTTVIMQNFQHQMNEYTENVSNVRNKALDTVRSFEIKQLLEPL